MQKNFVPGLRKLLEVCLSSVLPEVRPETPPTRTMDGKSNITNSYGSRGKVRCSVHLLGAEDLGRCNAFDEYAKKGLPSFEHMEDQDVVDPRTTEARRWTGDDVAADSELACPSVESFRVVQKGES
jgi:hypothetical protein